MKIKQLQKLLRAKELDGCLLYAEDPNFRYYVQEYLMSGAIFVPARGKPTLFVHPLESMEHDFKVVWLKERKVLREFFDENKIENIGYNPDFVNARKFFKLKNKFGLKDISEELELLRREKEPEEVKHLMKAARIAERILLRVVDSFNFRTEGELKKFIKTEMAREGVEQSFEPIVASGKGAAVPHYFGDKKISKGFMIIDMGVKWKGYCSDITRTFYIGEPSAEEKALYQKVLKVQEECIQMSTEGTECGDIFDHAKTKLGEKFTHGLGHGIGLKIHELPNFKPGVDTKLRDGMVFTIEPGHYDEEKGVGIRIEDDVMIKNGKPVLLTKMKKDLICF